MAHQDQVAPVFARGWDGGEYILALTFWYQATEKVISEAKLEQLRYEGNDRDQGRQPGSQTAGKRIEQESQEHEGAGKQVRGKDRTGAWEVFTNRS
jgi:hypothetical protein